MKTRNKVIALCAFGGLATVAAASATSQAAAPKPQSERQVAPPLPAATGAQKADIVFSPPRRGAPKTRTGGGTRTDGASIEVVVLAPEDPGLTVAAQPTLYWRLSSDSPGPFELVLTDEKQVKPLWRESRTEPLRAGIQARPVSAMNVSLAPGVVYRWSVALVRNPQQRSNDIVASGTVERVALEPSLETQLADAGTAATARASIFAANGLWYDAVDALSRAIEERPSDPTPASQRESLLHQVGLAPRSSLAQ